MGPQTRQQPIRTQTNQNPQNNKRIQNPYKHSTTTKIKRQLTSVKSIHVNTLVKTTLTIQSGTKKML